MRAPDALTAITIGLAVLVSVAPARAQGPLNLLPDFLDPDHAPDAQASGPLVPGGPVPLAPDFLTPDTGAATTPGAAALPPPVAVAPLDAVHPLDDGTALSGPVGVGDLWQGTAPGLVAPLLAGLPTPARGAVARQLTRQVLAGAPAAPDVAARVIDKLTAAGAAEDLAAFAGRLSMLQAPSVPPVVRGLAALRDRHRLCDAGLDRLSGPAGLDLDVMRAVALCRASADDPVGASVALDLAHEQGPVTEGFDRLVRALVGGERATAAAVDVADPLSLWAAAGLGIALPASAFADAPPLSLGLLASATASIEDRIGAAEQGVALGLVDPADLGLLYATGPAPTGAVAGLPPTLRRAALH
ncbi:MAG: hypothetical protein PHS60_08040, partial [Zavarzinia sp.]|nr:hypothetical protein [Zavarzinia sp.]